MFRDIGNYIRLAYAGYVMTREGLLRLVPEASLAPVAKLTLKTLRLLERRDFRDKACLHRLSEAFTELGPSWIKLGQFLSTRPDIIGAALASDLEQLQDQLPPFPQAEAEAIIAQALGKPVTEIFVSFGPAIAAASIAQVHKAQIEKNGVIETVAVKVLRPHVRAWFSRDLSAFFTAARLFERFNPSLRRLHPVGVVETLRASVAVEMDLRLEAAALSEMADNIKNDPDFHLPHVEWNLTTQNVLTTGWIEGIPLNDLEAVRAAGHDFKNLARILLQNFLRHALRDGFFHADLHQGNLFVDAQGRIAAVDLGIMGRLGTTERRFLAEILWSFIRRDYMRGADVHFDAGYVPPHHSRELFAQALRAIGEPIQQKKAQEISMARVLGQLFEYTELFDMETQLQLVMLQKTMVVTEGVARTLDPDLDIWAISEPVVSEWMQDNLGPKGQIKLANRTGRELGRFVLSMPQQLQNIRVITDYLAGMSVKGITLSDQSIRKIASARTKSMRWQTAALWLIALSLLGLLIF